MFSKAWNWIKSFWPKRSDNLDRFGLYHPREREIYEYFDGDKIVKADPMVLYKRVMAKGPEIAIDMSVARSPLKAAGKAHDDLIRKIRDIFNVKPLDVGGLTEQETMDLFDDFLIYVDAVKKNTTPPPTSQEGTLPPTSPSTAPSGDGSSALDPPSPSSSDSGSASNGSSTDTPPPSPTEQPLPSVQSVQG